ncbi:hypothetical protein GCM10023205_80480 [Yinghuangia aomiensis]|uniref:Uncharacterized protein n=1 Tax=Yinghuangia aomiensis TaxID=676205 RepID=A0ABP9IEI2_9ACTN
MRNSFKRALTTAGVTMALAAGSVATGSSAHAEGHDVYTAYSASSGYIMKPGMAYFFSYGDNFELYDQVADGDGVALLVDLYYSGAYYRVQHEYWGGGSGTYKKINYDFAEKAKIRFKVCTQNGSGGATDNCGSWTYATA